MRPLSAVVAGSGAVPYLNNRLREPLAAVLDRAPATWRDLIEGWRASADGRRLVENLHARQTAGAVIYPAAVLKALALTARPDVRVVILGQDPYHGPGQAEGLAFSVPAGVRLPPSLRNIFAEVEADLGRRPASGHLGGWAAQGVLLLNSSLTVEGGAPGSHARMGWEELTDAIVGAVAGDPGRRVFMLWGSHAQSKTALIEAAGGERHLVLKANHPSPLSARRPPVPFIGCRHFGAAQRHLTQTGGRGLPLDWTI